jgi:hypothetical protein
LAVGLRSLLLTALLARLLGLRHWVVVVDDELLHEVLLGASEGDEPVALVVVAAAPT